MTLDPAYYQVRLEAFQKGQVLLSYLLGQQAALALAQEAAAAEKARAKKVMDDGTAKTQAVYEAARQRAQAVAEAAQGKLKAEYEAVVEAQGGVVAAAGQVVAAAESELRAHEEVMKKLGLSASVFAPAAGGGHTRL